MASSSTNVPTFEQFFTLPSEEEFTAIALEGVNVEEVNETYRNMIIKIAYNISKFTTMRLFETTHESFVEFNARLKTAESDALDGPSDDQHDVLKARVKSLETIVNQSTSGSGNGRQPKIAEPPAFTGAEDKITLHEWLRLVTLWISHEGVTDDQKRIVVALSLLKGAAHKYMSSYYDKLEAGQSVGTWANFKNELVQIYGQRDDKEGAKKELTALFNNKDLATKNFVKYAEKFRTLGRLSGYDDALLIEKLRLVIDNSMRMCLIGARNNLPNRWTDFLDLLLDYYKELYPEKMQCKIFAKTESNDVPMEVDSAQKKKDKGKGKEVNLTEKSKDDRKKKYCHIHKSHGHNTEECKLNPKSSNFASKPEEKKKDAPKPGASSSKYKKIRAQEVEESDSSSSSESDTPPPPKKHRKKSKKAETNAVRVASTAYIEDVPSEDEPEAPLPTKGKPFDRQDFLKRYL